MKNNILAIMKKEFARFFKDKRMVLSTIFLPGIMIYVVYTLMGSGMSSMFQSAEDFVPTVYVENMPQIFENQDVLPVNFETADESNQEGILQKVKDGEKAYDLLMVFPEDFEQAVAVYDVSTETKAPEVEMYYNSTVTDSSTAYSMMREFLDQYEVSMSNKFDVNSLDKQYDLASDEDTAGMLFGMLVPLLLMIFLFSGCMAVAPESIAGEKERGTIATLLVTPLNRSHLAVGKILSLSVIAILSGISSFIGTMLSFPNLTGGMEGVSMNVYGASDYLMLLGIILSTVLVIVTLISVISAFAKNVKEATTWVTPVMVIVMVISLTAMIDSLKASSLWMYAIPLYNSVQCMSGIFSFSADVLSIITAIISNIIYTCVGVIVLTKMFNSEKVMFSK